VYTEESNVTSVLHGEASLAAVYCTVALVEDMIGHVASDSGTTAQQHVELRAQRDALFARLPRLLASWVPLGNDDDDEDGVPETEPPVGLGHAAALAGGHASAGTSTTSTLAGSPASLIALALQRGAEWEQAPHRSGGEVLYMPNTSPRLFVAERDRRPAPTLSTLRRGRSDNDDAGDGDDDDDTDDDNDDDDDDDGNKTREYSRSSLFYFLFFPPFIFFSQ
jgi:hypothetical protein